MPVKGYEGYYAVSDTGRVAGLMFKNNMYEFPKVTILSPEDNGYGYLIVGLCKPRHKRKNHYVHRLVAEAFLDNPDGCKYVNHIDFNKKNNRAENLEWCTQKKNVQHSSKRMKHPKSVSRPTNTGEKYIQKRKNGKFRVYIKPCSVCKEFKSLSQAVSFRNEVIFNEKYFANKL